MNPNTRLARAARHALVLAIALCGGARAGGAAEKSSDFAEALVAASRSPEIAAAEDVYAPLLGAWDVEARDRTGAGTFEVTRGEWLFARTLEGRAVQDVWIAPARGHRPVNGTLFPNRYGTSVRTFDPAQRHWQVTWLNPVTGAFDVLFTRMDGKRIVQEGTRSDGRHMRWIFQEVTGSSFHWTGEIQLPDGTWRLESEFFGRRRS
jgi:hypothetical protein